MQRLWTPWRMQYIAGEKNHECIFCSALSQQNDRETFIVSRGEHCFVILNKYPYNNGHLMVVPYAHTADLSSLGGAAQAEMMQAIARAIQWLTALSHPEGFNVGLNLGRAAGAGVTDHLHFHIVPRWVGDTNFMTITGETRVIAQWLDDTWSALQRLIAQDVSGGFPATQSD
ncbi:MAG: HIT domain-containing protein [Chloroflexi bacterium]|nr:HIT domain-containing protein [Chloroflexota bacterium]